MSGLLFLFAVGGFVLIAYWAYRNDVNAPDQADAGLLAMGAWAKKIKPMPHWKKSTAAPQEAPRGPKRRKPLLEEEVPTWRRGFLHRDKS